MSQNHKGFDTPQAYTRQEAGNHYVNMGMQPFQFAMANQWDFAASSILKYVSRHRAKNGIIDLRKSLHIVDIRLAEYQFRLPHQHRVPMTDYLILNNITGYDADTLLYLENWVNEDLDHKPLVGSINGLIKEYEVKNGETKNG